MKEVVKRKKKIRCIREKRNVFAGLFLILIGLLFLYGFRWEFVLIILGALILLKRWIEWK
ncbi:MAG: hypothetical protein GXO63_00845 [Candidatus Micrarchaeota archaeon]|nr:hypothetical protein [Candidatus Micrarchaeota archaeon]